MKKLPFKKQYQLIQLFHNLIASGFNLAEMVAFLEKSNLLEKIYLERMTSDLLNGYSLAQMISRLGYSDAIVTQLSLADSHGNTETCLKKIENYLENLSYLRKKTLEIITYPLILLSFLMVIMLGLRHYLLPQMEQNNGLTFFLTYFPSFCFIFILFLLLIGLTFYLRWQKYPRMKQIKQYSRLPLIGTYISLYMTAYYAREWGNLIGQGLDLATILQVMLKEKSYLMQEMCKDLQQSLMAGTSFSKTIASYPFFKKELSLMIEYGEIKSKLGQELEIYAQVSWERFFRKLLQATQFIQPLIFLFVAVIIVMIYAAMLLPMYQIIGGNM